MFDKTKMPPGLLKEVPGKVGKASDMKKAALQRRLATEKGKPVIGAK
jgi:hypothetical protein